MKGSHQSSDFVFLAVLPILAALLFLVFYVGGWVPFVPVPSYSGRWGSELLQIRQALAKNQAAVVTVAVATLVGIIGCTWAVMVLFDIRNGTRAFIRWIMRRPPRLVSGLLRPDAEQTWSVTMARVINDPTKRYHARSSSWVREQPH